MPEGEIKDIERAISQAFAIPARVLAEDIRATATEVDLARRAALGPRLYAAWNRVSAAVREEPTR